MSELYLVRHGQASFGAANCDQLSELGYQQARWLGEYFQDRDISFDRIICGDMARHVQTAKSLASAISTNPKLETHAGFNEFDFHGLIAVYLEQQPERSIDNQDRKQVFGLLREVMQAWSQDQLPLSKISETWGQFHQRVAEALRFAQEQQGRVLVASSGGALSVALQQIMNFDIETLININLQTRNSAFHQFYFNDKACHVMGVNHVPHLDLPERLDFITYA
jgi:broad specificity phosphatase PhoE